jgi:alkylhydroperoxidase/carboxymuconolactone decarboxylase family protein YurZ
MQTYEIAPDESMEMLVRTLSRMVRRDKDLVLVIPAGVNPFAGVESVSKLKGVMRSYDARLQVQAADPAVAALFQEAGIPVSPLTANTPLAPQAPAPQAAAPRPPANPRPIPAPATPPQPAIPHVVPSGQDTPPAAQAGPGGAGDLPADIANMNFDFEDVGQPAPANPAPYVPAPPQKGGFLQKLMGRSAPEPPPGRPRPDADHPLPQPDWAQSGAGPESADPFGEGPAGLDVTMPEWLRDAPAEPPAAGNRVVGRLPASNLDVTMPQIGGNAPSAGPGTGDLGVPSWLAEYGQGNPPSAPSPASTSAMPAWLAEDAGASSAAPAGPAGDAGGLPEWLRDETPVAPPFQPGPYSAPVPVWPAANTAQGNPPPAVPPAGGQASAAPPAPPAPAPPSQPAPTAGLGGPEQTAESITQAVRAAGLDGRTRALLIFGMALVRLAPGEAAAGAAATRQAGCSKEELQLVVEMAQALGGGPSERLGRKVLGS